LARQELLTLSNHADMVWSVDSSADGRFVVTAGKDRTAKIWDTTAGKELANLAGHTGVVTLVKFLPDARRVLTGSEDQSARLWLWEATSKPKVEALFRDEVDGFTPLALSRDGQWLVAADKDKSAWIWSVSAQRKLRKLQGHEGEGEIRSAAFSLDGQRV